MNMKKIVVVGIMMMKINKELTYPCQYCGVWWASGEEPGLETLEKTIAYCKDIMKCPIVGTPVPDEIINHSY